MKLRERLMAVVALVTLFAFAFVATAQNQSGSGTAPRTHEVPPYWAYAVDPPAAAPNAAAKRIDNVPRHVPGSTEAFTLSEVGDLFAPPDWHPGGHPAMPDIVAQGRKPDVFGCGYCHLPNGQGRPENASLAGLPAGYIAEQMADFKSGARKSSEPKQRPIAMMIAVATKANEQEIRAAAEYFSGLKPIPWIRVVETKTVPRTHVAGWMLVPAATGGREPIGHRIIETAENLQQVELRNDASGFVAYVPVGSVAKGKALVTAGGAGKTIPCAICHGPDLKGKGDVPSIAGRSPSYIVRQLFDIQNGTRGGADTLLMKPTVAKLTLDDMISIAAYAASLHP
jgi:cytochrome c553